MPTEAALKPYERQLEKWLPKASEVLRDGLLDEHLQAATAGADAVFRWRGPDRTITYVVECKVNLAHQDVWAVAQQLNRYRDQLGQDARARLIVFAPFIRRQQGAVLEQHDIDYVDLAGNVHLRPPGLFVHVEGLRPTSKPSRGRRRMTGGWVKTVLALLVKPNLIQQPYRPIAEVADVAPATVMTCLADLRTAGFVRRERGARHLTNTPELLALWIQAYVDVLRPKLVQRNFQMKIADKPERWHHLREVLGKRSIPWVLTGADAALLIDPHLRTEQTEIYAPPERFEEPELLRALQLQPAVTGNFQVIEPPAPVALQGETDHPEVPVAPLLLTYAELRYRNDDQANEAAELLLPQVLKRAKA